MSAGSTYNGLEIAVIGLSAKFPMSENYREFWQNLAAGRELIKILPEEELKGMGITDSEWNNDEYIKHVPVMENKGFFDHHFFGYSAEEAAWMDPQTRIFHEQCWKALEDAGYASQTGKTKIGLFAGASGNNNWKLYAHTGAASAALDPFYQGMIASADFMTTLVSYKLNLRGPSCYINTACSTSLVAVHMACRSLITRDCSIALAGGISAGSVKKKGYYYQEGMILSRDGHCRTFDAAATGTIPGEGAGVVVLKRLSEAIKDRDHIYAVIRATAVNNDGSNKIGYTAPGVTGQAECIIAAQKLAGINPQQITYIEAHGTGTRLGDPVEIRALNKAFTTGGKEKYCAMGSVKTNMGHTDAAAGVAGLIKTILSLSHRQLPASLHYNTANPEIDFTNGPFYVNAELTQWERRHDTPLCAGVSSFGIGGTNAHVIVEEAPAAAVTDPGLPAKVLCLSAKNPVILSRYIDELKQYITEEPGVDLADLAFSLQTGRKEFIYRKSGAYTDYESLLALLETALLKAEPVKSEDRNNEAVFMFPGQGTQYPGMCKGLYEQHAFFREQLDRGFALVQQLTGTDLKATLFNNEAQHIHATAHTQPIIFIVEYALAQWLIHIGIRPSCMIGHSIGEYVAACIAEVFSYEDALKIVLKRASLMNSLPGGSMLSLPVSAAEIKPWLTPGISLAAVNAPEQVVLSGDPLSVAALMTKLDEAGISYIKLQTSHAFHSSMQESILSEFEKAFENIALKKPVKRFVSNLTGDFIKEEEAISPAYWTKHLRQTVQFSAGIQKIVALRTGQVFIEAGPGRALSSLVNQQADESGIHCISLIPSARNSADDVKYLAEQTGKLWTLGITPDWTAYYANERRNKIPLPAYSFEPVLFPAEVNPLAGVKNFNGFQGGTTLKDWIYFPVWKRSLLLQADTVPDQQTILFLSAGNEFSRSLTAVLTDEGHKVVEVTEGTSYKKNSPLSYSINPAVSNDYTKLVATLDEDGITITHIIYGWGMDVQTGEMVMDAADPQTSRVYFSAVALFQALLKKNKLQGKRITILTTQLHQVTGAEQIAPAQSLLLGLVNVLPQEYGAVCNNIDIDSLNGQPELPFMVAKEILYNTGKEDRVVAYRYGQRWLQEYQQNTAAITAPHTRIKKGGIYLITGGLGNLGFLIARHLVHQYNATLLLTGRKKILVNADSNGSEKSTRIIRLEELKASSPDVHYYSMDISDGNALETLISDAEKNIGTINGVIHTAGVFDPADFELLEDITPEKTMRLFSPKIKGIENIYRVFKKRSPDFVMAASSVAAVLAGLGFSAYSSANLYMEHFIAARCRELPYWKCIGLAEMAFTLKDAAENSRALPPADIVSLFEWSSALKGVPVITETVEQLGSRISKAYYVKQESYLGEEITAPPVQKSERPDLSGSYVAPGTETETKLQEIFENFFNLQQVGVEDNFFELGGDSLKAMILLKRIKKEFAVSLTLYDFLSKTNIRDIAAKIDEVIWFRNDAQMENEITI